MLNVGNREKTVTLGRWPLRGPSRRGSAADEQDSRGRSKGVGVKAERNRRYDNNKCFVCGKQSHEQRDCPQRPQGKARKGVHGKSHGQTLIQHQQSTSSPAQHTPNKTTGITAVAAIPSASGYKTAS